ncbi:ABC transporter permease [Chitinophaga sp. GCM10012297]|uniref:Transport permease protein n=1 Tax=Chitinophaga chungangae TaxID=2821488 RepID=A0ABS3YA60_9BACT|nr:ABC transporter permease [Chitinophaga chungangae]MBO9151575.1 ABC transporter permease [Chitinophaga chungangae]
MKQFFVFVRKECYHIFRDKRTLLILFGMPLVLIVLFGFAITNEIHHVQIAVLDQSRDSYSQRLVQKMTASRYFTVNRYLSGEKDIEPAFRQGDVKMVMVIPNRFAHDFFHEKKAAIQLLTDASDPNTATTLINYANSMIMQYQQELTGELKLPLTISGEVQMVYNPSLKGVFLFVPGVMTLILMLVSAMMTSITITREKELGTMEILLVSPLKPVMIIAGKVIPYIVLSFLIALIILAMGAWVFAMPVKGSLLLLLLECILFGLTALSLGILISSVTNSQQTAMMISLMGLMLPTILLSGFVFPLESMPKALQVVANAIPAKWFNIILKDVMLKGMGLRQVWMPTLILCGMTVFFLAVSIRKFKIRLS